MKQAIRDGHELTRHPEFLGNLMAKRNAKLLDLYLDSDPLAWARKLGLADIEEILLKFSRRFAETRD